jgi:hypothetical protein
MKRNLWGLCPVLFLGFTGYSLSCTSGFYRPEFVVLFSAALALFGVYVFRHSAEGEKWQTPALGCVAVFFAGLQACVAVSFAGLLPWPWPPLLMYAQLGRAYQALQVCLWVAAVAVLVQFVLQGRRGSLLSFCVAALALFAARGLSLIASPDPIIDVFTILTEACRLLTDGVNPYTQTYPDIYLARDGISAYPPMLNYPPGLVYWLLPFGTFAKDIRAGYIVADVAAAVVLYSVARKVGKSEAFARYLALSWAAFPTCLFTLEQAWVDAFLIMTIALLVWCLLDGRWVAAGVAAGFTLAAKQYAVIFVPFIAIWLFRRPDLDRPKAVRLVLSSTLTVLALYLPFFLAAPKTLFTCLVTSLLAQPRRLDALTWIALLENEFGVSLPSAAILGISASAVVALTLAPAVKKTASLGLCLGCSVLLHGVVFLFGKQAFCNYYQLLAYLTCLYLAAAGQTKLPAVVAGNGRG